MEDLKEKLLYSKIEIIPITTENQFEIVKKELENILMNQKDFNRLFDNNLYRENFLNYVNYLYNIRIYKKIIDSKDKTSKNISKMFSPVAEKNLDKLLSTN